MKYIISSRGMGKTAALIREAANKNGYIVCQSTESASHIQSMAREMNIQINQPITYEEFINRRYYGKGISCFHIDNVDILLQYMSSVPINTIALSIENNFE